jgi:hypothetical protein
MGTSNQISRTDLSEWECHQICRALEGAVVTADDPPISAFADEILQAVTDVGNCPNSRKNALMQALQDLDDGDAILKAIVGQKGKETPPRPYVAPPRRMSMRELRKRTFPSEKWIVFKLIPQGLTVLAGKSNTRKSWIALELAHAVARGEEFWGRRTEPGPAVYYALEDSLENTQERCVTQGHVADVDIEVVTDFDEPERTDVIETIRSDMTAFKPKLVIVDTLSTLLRNADQNSPEAMTEALNRLQGLAFEFGAAICVVHHAKKGYADLDGFDEGDWYDAIRGSTAIVNAADAKLLIGVRRGKGETEARIRGGGRRFRDEIDLRLQWNPDTCVYKVEGDWFVSGFRSSEQRLIEILKQNGGRVESSQKLAELAGITPGNVARDLKRLKQQGIVAEEPNGSSKAFFLKSQMQ